MNIDELIALTDPALIDAMLYQAGLGERGGVRSVGAQVARFPFLNNGASNNALFLELAVEYENGGATLPESLVLKAGNNVAGTAEREIAFYSHLDSDAVPGALRCYGSRFLQNQDVGLLLLEHAGAGITFEGPEPGDLGLYQGAVQTLADLHAWRWDHPGLGSGDFAVSWNEPFVEAAMGMARDSLSELGEPDLARLAGAALEGLSASLVSRARSGPLCVTHGDAALWNFVMAPGQPVRMLDFQMWGVNPPAWDLGYMLVLLWPAELRRAHGDKLIDAYLARLAEHGIHYGSQLRADLPLISRGLVALGLANLNAGIWEREVVVERLAWTLAACDEFG